MFLQRPSFWRNAKGFLRVRTGYPRQPKPDAFHWNIPATHSALTPKRID